MCFCGIYYEIRPIKINQKNKIYKTHAIVVE